MSSKIVGRAALPMSGLFAVLAVAACGDSNVAQQVAILTEQNEMLRAQNATLQQQIGGGAPAEGSADGANVNFTYVPLGDGRRLPPDVAALVGRTGNETEAPRLSARGDALRGIWVAGTQPQDAVTIQFGETISTISSPDGRREAFVVDYSGENTLCLYQPDCVVSIGADGGVRAQFFDVSRERIIPIECVDWNDVGEAPNIPTDEEFLASSGRTVVRRDGPVVCFAVDGAPEFRRYHANDMLNAELAERRGEDAPPVPADFLPPPPEDRPEWLDLPPPSTETPLPAVTP
jgi:hypothetical protein